MSEKWFCYVLFIELYGRGERTKQYKGRISTAESKTYDTRMNKYVDIGQNSYFQRKDEYIHCIGMVQ